jgi:hypothetical protein
MKIKQKHLKRLLEVRYHDGFDAGYDEGKELGDVEGFERGFNAGHKEAVAELARRGVIMEGGLAAPFVPQGAPINYGLTAEELNEAREEDDSITPHDSGDECACPKCKWQKEPYTD